LVGKPDRLERATETKAHNKSGGAMAREGVSGHAGDSPFLLIWLETRTLNRSRPVVDDFREICGGTEKTGHECTSVLGLVERLRSDIWREPDTLNGRIKSIAITYALIKSSLIFDCFG